MDNNGLEKRILEEIEEYLESEESFGDTAMLCINPETKEIAVVDGEDLSAEDMDNSEKDYYDIIELLEMDPEKGNWYPDMEAIKEVAKEY